LAIEDGYGFVWFNESATIYGGQDITDDVMKKITGK